MEELRALSCSLAFSTVDTQVELAKEFAEKGELDTAKFILKNLNTGAVARLRKRGIYALGPVCEIEVSDLAKTINEAIKRLNLKKTEESLAAIGEVSKELETSFKKSKWWKEYGET